MRVGSLFSGIGGLDLGLERAGMEIIWQVENNEFCQKVLKKHWAEVPCYGDIKEIDFSALPPVDLICGGVPCQPVSCAGKQQGDKDGRWLWPEYLRAIQEIKPKWVLGENVPGLLSNSNGRLFGGILRDLASSGYDAEWDCLPAVSFGAPHLRFRTFIVAHSKGMDDSWCFEKENRREFQRCVELGRCAAQGWQKTYAEICGMDDEVPPELDRLKSLGNAVVPQVAEWIGRRIMEAVND